MGLNWHPLDEYFRGIVKGDFSEPIDADRSPISPFKEEVESKFDFARRAIGEYAEEHGEYKLIEDVRAILKELDRGDLKLELGVLRTSVDLLMEVKVKLENGVRLVEPMEGATEATIKVSNVISESIQDFSPAIISHARAKLERQIEELEGELYG